MVAYCDISKVYRCVLQFKQLTNLILHLPKPVAGHFKHNVITGGDLRPENYRNYIFRDEMTKTIIAWIPFGAPQTQFYTLVWWPKSCKDV